MNTNKKLAKPVSVRFTHDEYMAMYSDAVAHSPEIKVSALVRDRCNGYKEIIANIPNVLAHIKALRDELQRDLDRKVLFEMLNEIEKSVVNISPFEFMPEYHNKFYEETNLDNIDDVILLNSNVFPDSHIIQELKKADIAPTDHVRIDRGLEIYEYNRKEVLTSNKVIPSTIGLLENNMEYSNKRIRDNPKYMEYDEVKALRRFGERKKKSSNKGRN